MMALRDARLLSCGQGLYCGATELPSTARLTSSQRRPPLSSAALGPGALCEFGATLDGECAVAAAGLGGQRSSSGEGHSNLEHLHTGTSQVEGRVLAHAGW